MSEQDPSPEQNQFLEHNHSSDHDYALKHNYSSGQDHFSKHDHSSEYIQSEKNSNRNIGPTGWNCYTGNDTQDHNDTSLLKPSNNPDHGVQV